jgi:hypothetical protein
VLMLEKIFNVFVKKKKASRPDLFIVKDISIK